VSIESADHQWARNLFLPFWMVMGVTKVRLVTIGVCPFIRDKGDKCKSGIYNLRDGSQLYANK